MTTNETILSNLNDATAAAGQLGAITFWSLRGTRLRRQDLRAALDAIGLGFAMPKDPKPQALLRLAIDQARRVHPNLVFDRVHQTATEIVYAVSGRDLDETAELASYRHRTRVRLDRTTGALALEDSQDPVSIEVEKRYSDLHDWITVTEVGSVLINALRGRKRDVGLCAVNLRGESGGVYFVPRVNVDRLAALANAIDALGNHGALTVWPIPVGDRTLVQASAAAQADFGARLAEARADVEALAADLASDSADGGDREESRILARAQAFAQIRTRIEVYADLLGDVREGLLAQVTGLETTLRARLAASFAETEGTAAAAE